MRILVACPDCKRQYDASNLAEESRFRCLCGALLRVHRPEPHDAAVVRCSACGAPRQSGSDSCQFCGADFTLHERDLHTICPGCMARVSDRARFCHHCASPLLPSGTAGEPGEQDCPVCPNAQKLTSRQIGDPAIGVLECPRCAGLWLSTPELQHLLQRVRARSARSDSELGPQPSSYPSNRQVSQDGPLYRACPDCGKLMHRRNFGRKSGVIVDQCRAHGYWFDSQELESILHWVQGGGEHQVSRLEREETRDAARSERLARQLEPAGGDWPQAHRGSRNLTEVLAWLFSRVIVR